MQGWRDTPTLCATCVGPHRGRGLFGADPVGNGCNLSTVKRVYRLPSAKSRCRRRLGSFTAAGMVAMASFSTPVSRIIRSTLIRPGAGQAADLVGAPRWSRSDSIDADEVQPHLRVGIGQGGPAQPRLLHAVEVVGQSTHLTYEIH